MDEEHGKGTGSGGLRAMLASQVGQLDCMVAMQSLGTKNLQNINVDTIWLCCMETQLIYFQSHVVPTTVLQGYMNQPLEFGATCESYSLHTLSTVKLMNTHL